MKSSRVAVLAGVVLFVFCLADAFGWDSEYRQGFALSHFVERSNLIVVGQVIKIEYVTRENIQGRYTTDITVAVDQTVKGKPNISKTRVKFMIRGGRRLIDMSVPKFALGEKVLLFMTNSDKGYYVNYPYDKLCPYRAAYGKLAIKDDKVYLVYAMENDKLKPVRMPLDLAVQLSKAAIKDKDAVVELEKDIKDAIVQRTGSDTNLSQTLVDRLMEETKEIVDKNTEPENQESQSQD